ncbi:MAG: MBL fold metallo-hydrolase [candidate division KSB1 bacterium]|nr:MBL fold metallo-hydrolase [candidate division KSB1 bacterium]
MIANTASKQAFAALTYLGHATVKIKTSEGKIIYIDPYQPGDYSDSADVVLITHQHSDHNRLNLVRQRPTCKVIQNFDAIQNNVYQSFTVGNIKIAAVAAYNANHQKSQCVGYVVEVDGIKLYHAGDTGVIPEMADLAARELTYALLPIDGVFTMSPEQATQAAAMIKAKYNIPIHTMGTPDTFNVANVARFTPPNKIVVRPGETIELKDAATSVEDFQERPAMFTLGQNYPNPFGRLPFNPSTTISYSIPAAGRVILKVYDVLGQEQAELVNSHQRAGDHKVTFVADHLPSGVYLYRIQVGQFTETKKCILMK